MKLNHFGCNVATFTRTSSDIVGTLEKSLYVYDNDQEL